MPGDRRSIGRDLYGQDPAGYDAGRPDYPAELYALLREHGLAPGAAVLEVGPGSGLCTRHLVSAGARVTAVEPNAALAGYLRRALPEIEIVGSTLEDAALPDAAVDLAVAATSLHWVDPETALRVLRSAVRPGGAVVAWWMLFDDPDRPDPFSRGVDELLGVASPPTADDPYSGSDVWIGGLTVAGYTDVAAHRFAEEHVMGPERTRALYGSLAIVLKRPAVERPPLLDRIAALVAEQPGGRVTRRFTTVAYAARVPPAAAR